MPKPAKIPVKTALSELPGWKAAKGRDAIERSFKFADFNAAFAFMTEVALSASRLDHHPEWSNVYNKVEVLLTTHESGGVTARDIDLAKIMDAAAVGG